MGAYLGLRTSTEQDGSDRTLTDDAYLCDEFVALGLLERKRHPNRRLTVSQYVLTDAGIEAAG